MQLPAGIRSRVVAGVNGLDMHVLEAGFETRGRRCVVLLHGFPELAYSWRRIMLPLAAAGFHVVALDQRGYGCTTGWDARYDGDLASFHLLNLVEDAAQLIAALGYRNVAAVIGHDFGSPVAAWAALTRPELFRSVVLMSAPFRGPPPARLPATLDVHAELAALARPRKHYQWYYSTREANRDMLECVQGAHAFLRAYFHMKSADWKANRPYPLAAWSATELAKLPTYYIMDLDRDMAETVAPEMPAASEIAACAWLPEDALRVYSAEFGRTGFQGGLQWYRCLTVREFIPELQKYAGRVIDVPSVFISGASDWGTYQRPGDFEQMQSSGCTRMLGCHLVEGAGHWVQQEQPERVCQLLLEFLNQTISS